MTIAKSFYPKIEQPAHKVDSHKYIDIEYYSLPASAGSGVDLDGCEKEMIKVRRSELTDAANFAVRISGSSMEPVFRDGQIALVRSQPTIEKGEIGIFIVNGNGYIKELGDGELISLNPKYDNVPLHDHDDIYCRGEVIGTLEQEDILK